MTFCAAKLTCSRKCFACICSKTPKRHVLHNKTEQISFCVAKHAQTLNPSQDFNQFEINDGQNIPTFVGPNETNSVITVAGEPLFNAPKGNDLPIMPLPYFQGSIGGPKKTEILFRFSPFKLDLGRLEFNYWGIGLKHDLLQWIPIIGDAIPMSFSIQGGYTDLTTKLKIDDQEISLNSRSTTLNLIASKKILLITGYAGIGYNSSNTIFKADAKFNLDDIQFDKELEINFENKNDLRTNIGVRINITLVTIHADYTFSKYPTATVGIGVSLR